MKVLRWLLGGGLVVAILLMLAFVLSAATPPMADSESARRLGPGPHPVATFETAFVDESRPTPANGDFAGSPARTLDATLWFPEAAEGSHALVAYSHGFMSSRGENADLARLLASHGFVVVAIDFPLTNMNAPGGPNVSDVVSQPEDVRFVIDRMLDWKVDEKPFAGRIDPERIGAVGLSLGGLTTELATFHPRMRDPRIRAAVSIAGPSAMFTREFFATADVPFLMIAGTSDAMVPFDENAAPIPEKIRRGGLLSISGASHAGFAIFSDMFPMRFLSNPDSIGCWALTSNLGDTPPREFFNALGDARDGVVVDPETTLPCRHGAPSEALPAGRQLMISRLAAFAFLQSEFAADPAERAAHAAYLRETLPHDFLEASFVPARASGTLGRAGLGSEREGRDTGALTANAAAR